MPAVSKKQRQFMAIELEKAKAGEATKTGMSVKQLEHYANTPEEGLPDRIPGRLRKRLQGSSIKPLQRSSIRKR